MQNTRPSWLSAAHGAGWFQLTRHDDPESADPPAPEPTVEPDDSEPDPDGADSLGDKGKQALDRMKAEKAEAKRAAAAEKKRADDLARKVAEFEDRDKSDADKLASRAEAAEKRAEVATARAVKAEVRALAASEFADPEDAAAFLDLSQYATDGEIDTDALQSDLADLLERKPHLRKQTATPPEQKKGPKPDPSQGPRKEPEPTDWRTADKADFKKHIAKYGARLP